MGPCSTPAHRTSLPDSQSVPRKQSSGFQALNHPWKTRWILSVVPGETFARLHDDVAWCRSFSTFASSCCLLRSFVWHFFFKGLPNLVPFWWHRGSKTYNFPIAPLGSKSGRRKEASAAACKLHTSYKQQDMSLFGVRPQEPKKGRKVLVQSILVYDNDRPRGSNVFFPMLISNVYFQCFIFNAYF